MSTRVCVENIEKPLPFGIPHDNKSFEILTPQVQCHHIQVPLNELRTKAEASKNIHILTKSAQGLSAVLYLQTFQKHGTSRMVQINGVTDNTLEEKKIISKYIFKTKKNHYLY